MKRYIKVEGFGYVCAGGINGNDGLYIETDQGPKAAIDFTNKHDAHHTARVIREFRSVGDHKVTVVVRRKVDPRVRIARDVLAQLDLGKLTARSMTYGYRVGDTCRVCALGALFAARCGDAAQFAYEHGPATQRDMQAALSAYFSAGELHEIEQWFENCADDSDWFAEKYPSDEARMRLIMQNIIDNKGEFKPGLLT